MARLVAMSKAINVASCYWLNCNHDLYAAHNTLKLFEGVFPELSNRDAVSTHVIFLLGSGATLIGAISKRIFQDAMQIWGDEGLRQAVVETSLEVTLPILGKSMS